MAMRLELATAGVCGQPDNPIRRDLWHALIFYATGEVIKPLIDPESDAPDGRPLPNRSGGTNASQDGRRSSEDAQYTPYAKREGLYQRGWENYLQMLTRYWQPYLEGRVTFDDAIAHMVSAL